MTDYPISRYLDGRRYTVEFANQFKLSSTRQAIYRAAKKACVPVQTRTFGLTLHVQAGEKALAS